MSMADRQKFIVYMTQVVEARVEVLAENYDDAIDEAFKSPELPHSLCWQCASRFGLGGQWEPSSVTAADGKLLWEEKR
ncbi:hypothetical protein SEA_PRINGAR_101 [Mycobacterium phage Pringar]|uniref:Uncharacterized protein n=2 Tax=Marvinvirus marvin TaxID=1982092 RepID=A0A3G8FEX3_9CAUD|nr:hypothetical protein SEA_BEELZEBUB_109 [Mycobacterium phage Beelzebub]QFP96962.1 hypothetical protein SEA_PRINGAR_101 [Mycobacterium phage Pringar]